jgi:hypothetical protein
MQGEGQISSENLLNSAPSPRPHTWTSTARALSSKTSVNQQPEERP